MSLASSCLRSGTSTLPDLAIAWVESTASRALGLQSCRVWQAQLAASSAAGDQGASATSS